jgi:hypothetical protein
MEVVSNPKFSDVLISKLEYFNSKYINNDLLGKTEMNFSLLKDYSTDRLNFSTRDLLDDYFD